MLNKSNLEESRKCGISQYLTELALDQRRQFFCKKLDLSELVIVVTRELHYEYKTFCGGMEEINKAGIFSQFLEEQVHN